VTYLESLSSELATVGIRGRLRRRILLEIGDHLDSDPQARLGAPGDLARQFADELGTTRARRAALVTFAALAVAAAMLLVSWAGSKATGVAWPRVHPPSRPVANLAFVLLAIGSQVAFAAGVLGVVRALRRRSALVVPRAEATVIGRRAIVALLAGVAAMAGLALIGFEFRRGQPAWWMPVTLAGAGVAAGGLLAAMVIVAAALRLRPVAPGEAGDLFVDLGPLAPPVLRARPWRLALAVAAALAVIITVGGALQSDGYDGAVRGVADGLACLAGFALLGPYLGLRAARD
jgi:uncharacterized membrane protein YbhN (UPF0104 family)